MNTPSQPQDPANSLPDPNAAPQQPDPNAAPSQPQPVNAANQPATGAEKPIAAKFNGDVYAWFLKDLCHVADLSEVGEFELMCGADGDDDVTDARFNRVYKIHSREYKAKTGNELPLPPPNSTPVTSIFDTYLRAHPVPPPQPVAQPVPQSAQQPAPAQADPGTQQMPASAAPVQDPATIPQAPADPGQAPADPAQTPADPGQAPAQNPNPLSFGTVSAEEAFQNFLRDFMPACDPEKFNSLTEQDLRDLCLEFQQTNSYVVRDVAHFVELKGLNLPPDAPAEPVNKYKIMLFGGIGVASLALAGIIYTSRDKINSFFDSTDNRPAPTAKASAKPSATPAPQPSSAPSPKPVATTEPSVVPVAPPPSAIPTETAAPTPAPAPTATASAAPTTAPIASAEPAPQPSATAPVQPGRIPLQAFTVLCTNRSIPENCKPADPAVIPYINTCKFDGIQYLTRPLTIPCTDAQGYPGPVYTTKYRIQDRAAYSGTPYGENVEFTVYLNE